MKCRWARGMCVDFAEWQAIKTKDGKPTDDCTWIYMYIYCVQMWLWIVSHHVSHTCIAYKCTRYASSRHCTLTQLPVLCTLLLWCYAIYSSLVVYFLLLYYYFEHCIVARKRYTWLFVLASCGVAGVLELHFGEFMYMIRLHQIVWCFTAHWIEQPIEQNNNITITSANISISSTSSSRFCWCTNNNCEEDECLTRCEMILAAIECVVNNNNNKHKEHFFSSFINNMRKYTGTCLGCHNIHKYTETTTNGIGIAGLNWIQLLRHLMPLPKSRLHIHVIIARMHPYTHLLSRIRI